MAWYLLFVVFLSQTNAETLKLLEIPLDNGRFAIFSVNQNKKCSFEGIDEIQSNELRVGHKKNWLIEKINLLQRKINFTVTHPQFNSEVISFSLSNASNIRFEFVLIDCEVKKRVHINDKTIPFDEIDIEYSNTLNSPVIKNMIIVAEDNYLNIFLYPWALHGQISTYEFSAGIALKIHSNLRVNNQNDFQKNDPAFEPIPAFFFRYGPFFLSKDGLGSLIYHTGDFSLIGMGIIEGEPYQANGLEKRNQGIFLGTILKYNFFEFIYYKDYFKEKGYNLKIKIAPEIYTSMDWKLTPQLFVQYWDNHYVDYYFGVNSSESNSSGLKEYRGHHTINYGAVMEGIHYVKNWSYVMDIGIKTFGKEVSSSPIVNKKNELHITTAILYRFF